MVVVKSTKPKPKIPKYKLKSTGEEREGVYDPKKGAYVSPFSTTELEASKAITDKQQKVALEEEILKQGGAVIEPKTDEEVPAEQLPAEEMPQEPQTKIGAFTQKLTGLDTREDIGAGDILQSDIKAFSTLYLAARNFLSTKGSLDYTKSSQSYSDMKTQLNNDLNLVRQGVLGADVVEKEIQQLEIYNNALGGSAKKWYNKNLAYWADNNGKAIQEEFEINSRAIESLNIQLEQAKRQGQLTSLAGGSVAQ